MAWRQIHDDVPVSRTLNAVSDFAERLYWRLLSQTDQWGRLPGDTCKIRAKCVPMLERADAEIDNALEELVRAARIELYFVDGTRYCQLLDFDDRQTAGKMKRKPSLYPVPPGNSLLDRGSPRPEQDQIPEDRTPEQTRAPEPDAREQVAALVDESLKSGSAVQAAARTSEAPDVERLLALLPPHEIKPNTRGVLERKFRALPPHLLDRACQELEAADGVRSRVRYLNGIADRMLAELSTRREGQYA